MKSNSIKNVRIYAGCTHRNVATMENQDWSHRHATWEVNAFLMLPTGCCRSYNTQSARLHQQLNAFLMPACLTGSLSLLQYTVDAPLHLNAMKCKGSAPWTLMLEGESQTRARPLTRVTTSEAPFLDKITPSSLFHLPGLPSYMVPPFRQ